MTNPGQQPPSDGEHVWGAPQSAPAWSTKKILAAVGIAAVIAGAGGGAIYAAAHHTNTDRGFGGPGGGPGMSMNGAAGSRGQNGSTGPGAVMSGPALHGEFVVSDGNGGYTTELTQTGTVTAISSTSVTAKSADDYSHTYTITATTTSASVKVGDTVSIRGTEKDGTATATAITTGTTSDAGPQANGGMGGPGMGQPMDGQQRRPGS